MKLHTITIEQLRQRDSQTGFYYRDHLFITDKVEGIERFKQPCRIDAMTALICTGGNIDCSVNLKHYHVGSDMILINFPDDIIQIHRAEALEAYAILISSDFLNELGIDMKLRSDFYLDIRQNAVCRIPHKEIATLKPYYALLSGNIGKPRAETPEVIRGLIHAFSHTVISIMRVFKDTDKDEKDAGMARNKQLFHKFMALVKLHHTHARGVKYYADKLCITANYLSGAIKEYTGKTATEWVNEYVILEAKIMLKDSDMSIQEIAYKLNFSSQSAFGKWFKLQAGVGPKKYRNTVK